MTTSEASRRQTRNELGVSALDQNAQCLSLGSPENPWVAAFVRVLVVPAVDGCPVAVLACPGPRRPCGVCLTYLLTYLLWAYTRASESTSSIFIGRRHRPR